ncbi:hypothetical protein DBY21_05425 [Candidatus Gastranaerophilales bacterium]|nr:MAG: hypothetical protein DBY21_05425 [Candidatus Gastranaerophilales bacterium]
MQIQNIQNIKNVSSNSFTGKIRTRILLESIGGNIINMSKRDNSIRLDGFSSITDIPKEKLAEKLYNESNLQLFMDSLCNVVKQRYPKLLEAGQKYKDDLFMLLLSGQLGSKKAFVDLSNKYDKKFGRYLNINLDEGEKRFFQKYIDMF